MQSEAEKRICTFFEQNVKEKKSDAFKNFYTDIYDVINGFF